tara:strand:+ start:735 stop:908 length:174 start_codon:yes stop_codon:yes gene_type:complete
LIGDKMKRYYKAHDTLKEARESYSELYQDLKGKKPNVQDWSLAKLNIMYHQLQREVA